MPLHPPLTTSRGPDCPDDCDLDDATGVAAGNQVYLRYGDPHNRDTYLVRQIDLVSTE